MAFTIRIAAAATPQEENLSPLQLGAMGIAAASPFGGLIGRQKLRHDPLQGAEGKRYRNLSELARDARPGDVLITSKPQGSVFKTIIDPIGGSQFYHAQPVVGRSRGVGQTLSAGDLSEWDYSDPRAALDDAWSIPAHLNNEVNQYRDVVLLRPKNLKASEKARLLDSYGERLPRYYDNPKAVATGLRELFVPKLDFLTRGRAETVCEGNVCSTLPAMAHYEATGRRVIPGKASQDVFPTDFLRSAEYDLVGSRVTPETAALQGKLSRKLAPWLLRGGLGAGLAGATYAASENPEATAATAGAGAGAYAANKFLRRPEGLPTLTDVYSNAVVDFLADGPAAMVRNKELHQDLLNYARKRGAVLGAGALLGAGAGYAGLRGAQELMQRHRDKS